MRSHNRRLWSAKLRTEIDVGLGQIYPLLKPDGVKNDEVWLLNLGVWFLITGQDCLRQWGYNDSVVIAPGKNPNFFMRVPGREGSGLRSCPGFHASAYYPVEVRKKLASLLYKKRDDFTVSSALRSPVLAVMEPEVRGVSQTSVSHVSYSKRQTASSWESLWWYGLLLERTGKQLKS